MKTRRNFYYNLHNSNTKRTNYTIIPNSTYVNKIIRHNFLQTMLQYDKRTEVTRGLSIASKVCKLSIPISILTVL